MAIVAKKEQPMKIAAINELKEAFESASDFIFTDYRGLTVEQITNLRKRLMGKEAIFKVVKNNFARIAFEQISAPDVSSYLIGPTAVTITSKDSNEVAKTLFGFIKEVPYLKIKGGLIGNSMYTSQQMDAFAKLPGKVQLIAMLMSCMNGSVRNLATALNNVNERLVRTLKAIGDTKVEA
jgi:large subunit ribosomal protein L10